VACEGLFGGASVEQIAVVHRNEAPLERLCEGPIWYWPEKAPNQQRPPLRLRLLRVWGKQKQDVGLLTNVQEQKRLGRRAAERYRWRWQVEGGFRAYQRTLLKIKLCSRTEALVYREAEVVWLGLQLLLVQAASRTRVESVAVIVLGSARQQLLKLRGEMTTCVGACLGPSRQRAVVSRAVGRSTCGGPRGAKGGGSGRVARIIKPPSRRNGGCCRSGSKPRSTGCF